MFDYALYRTPNPAHLSPVLILYRVGLREFYFRIGIARGIIVSPRLESKFERHPSLIAANVLSRWGYSAVHVESYTALFADILFLTYLSVSGRDLNTNIGSLFA